MLCEAVEPPTCMWLFILKYNFILNENRGAHLVAFFQKIFCRSFALEIALDSFAFFNGEMNHPAWLAVGCCLTYIFHGFNRTVIERFCKMKTQGNVGKRIFMQVS